MNVEAKQIALVTGASSGIGAAIAARLASDGFHTLIHFSKNAGGAEATLTRVRQAGGTGEVIGFDVRDKQAAEAALEGYFKDKPPLYCLINNAGAHRDNLAGLMTDEEFDDVMKTNVYGPFYLKRWCTRRMVRARKGCIVNLASLSGQMGNAGQINYAASKAALIAMTKTLSQELGSRGIRVNAVSPGIIETDMIKEVPQFESFKDRIPLKRFGTPEEVAGVVSFLCSRDASYVTGQTVSVNGGLFPA